MRHEVPVVVVHLDRRQRQGLLRRREEHRLVLLRDGLRFRHLVPHRDSRDHGRLQAGAGGCRGHRADLRRPRCRRVHVGDGDALGHCGHHRGLVLSGCRFGHLLRHCGRRWGRRGGSGTEGRRGPGHGSLGLGGDRRCLGCGGLLRGGGHLGRCGRHDLRDLIAGHRPAQIAARPLGAELLDVVLAGFADEELPLAQRRNRLRDVDSGWHPFQQPCLVVLRGQPPDHPRARVAHRLVVDVHRVLGAQHDAEAERPRLLHQQHDRLLRRRVGGGRQVAGDLVHVEQRTQVGGPALSAHPRDELAQDQRGRALAVLVGQVRGGDDRAARPAVGGPQHGLDVDGLAGDPVGEGRRREHGVELHRERLPVLGWEELVEVEHAESAHRRLVHTSEQRR